MMSGEYKVSQRVQLWEFILVASIFGATVAGIITIGNVYPDLMSAPLAIGILFAGMATGALLIAIPKRGRILTIRGSKWTLTGEKSGRTLVDFDLSLNHSLAVVIRQGVIGKSGRSICRWVQIILAQNGRVIKIESPYMDSITVKSVTGPEIVQEAGGFRNQILIKLAEKPYALDESLHQRTIQRPGAATYGLSSFLATKQEDLIVAIMDSASENTARNSFLHQMGTLKSRNASYGDLKKELASLTTQKLDWV